MFFGACLKDYICRADFGREIMESPGFEDHDVTIREFDSDHWVLLSHADELSRALEQWKTPSFHRYYSPYSAALDAVKHLAG